MKVLIVDDEQEMRQLIEIMLSSTPFEAIPVGDGKTALEVLQKEQIELVLLDVMMPELDGFEVCKRVRQFSSVPIIFLTAMDANEDKVKGLNLGADDYVVKPFTASELIARMQAVLRRTGSLVFEIEQKLLIRGDIKLDEVSRKVYVDEEHVSLTLKEYELLHLFMLNPEIVYSRDTLLEKVWGYEYCGGTRTVDTHIKTLRIKLGRFSKGASEAIQTVWGIGYRFELMK